MSARLWEGADALKRLCVVEVELWAAELAVSVRIDPAEQAPVEEEAVASLTEADPLVSVVVTNLEELSFDRGVNGGRLDAAAPSAALASAYRHTSPPEWMRRAP